MGLGGLTRITGFSGVTRSWGRYVTGLCVAALGLCAAGWLVLVPFAFGYRGHRAHTAALADLATGAALGVVSLVVLVLWAHTWRVKLRADGILPGMSRGRARREARREARQQRERELERQQAQAQALDRVRALREQDQPAAAPPVAPRQPDPTQVLNDLRTLLGMLRDAPAPREAPPDAAPEPEPEVPVAEVPAPRPHLEPMPGPREPAGIAAIESMLAGAELLVVGSGEEESW